MSEEIYTLFAPGPLVPGNVYVLPDYDGSCDGCGADTPFPFSFLPVRFIGEYEELFCKYWYWETMLYFFCPGCHKDITAIKTYINGINVAAKEAGLENRP